MLFYKKKEYNGVQRQISYSPIELGLAELGLAEDGRVNDEHGRLPAETNICGEEKLYNSEND